MIKLPQIMVWQQQKQYKGSVSSAVVQDAAVADFMIDETHKKSTLCIQLNSHSKACLETTVKCTLTSYHKSLTLVCTTYPHCAIYTGSMTHGISFTKVMAPVMWYNTFTSRICSQGIGMFSKSFITA